MAQANVKPPVLRSGETYEMWKKKIRLWEKCTNLARDARAPAIVLILEGAAQTAALKIDTDTLASDDGVEALLTKLDKLFKEDEDQITFSVYDTFEKFRKTDSMSLTEYLIQFELLYEKAKAYNNVLTEPVLAYRLLKGANLSEHKQELARATCAKWNYETLKLQLKKIFDANAKESSACYLDKVSNEFSEMNIKSEPTHFGQAHREEETYFGKGRTNYNRRYENRYNEPTYEEEETYFGKGRTNYNRRYENRYNEPRRREETHRQLNPMFNGVRMKCIACKSIYHLIKDCPHKSGNRNPNEHWRRNPQALYIADSETEPDEVFIQLFMSSLIPAEETQKEITECYVSALVGECLQKCILDSGCNQNVAGVEWSNDYVSSLEYADRMKVKASPSNTKFKFGDGRTYTAIEKLNVPAEIAKKKVMIEYHVVAAELPLLLSKNGMKDAQCKMDYANEKVEMFGKPVKPGFTKSGHYTIPLNSKVQAGTENNTNTNVMFNIKQLDEKSFKEKRKMMEKVHKTFGHPSEVRLKKLIKDGGIEDEEIMKAVEKVTNECEVCVKYKRTPSHPIVSTSLARHFNEVVTLDLFFYKQTPIIHICDVATRFSRASVIPSKNKNAVISAICVLWVSLFGPPQKILSDNGGEFTSHDFREMGEKLNTQILSTAAESPWSNGINERHHALIENMLHKIQEENKFPLQVALSWAVAAKNALANVYGYSPNQLVFGHNPNYPSVLTSELPALENDYDSKNILAQMKAREAAREAFIRAESCEKLKRALNRKTRNINPMEYEVGEEVFYKREQEGRWRGPGRIIGKDGKIIIIRHQANVISVPSCMIQHRYPIQEDNKNEIKTLSQRMNQHEQSIQNQTQNEGDNDEWEAFEQFRTIPEQPAIQVQQPTVQPANENEENFPEFDQLNELLQVIPEQREIEMQEIFQANDMVDEIVENVEARRRGRKPKKTKPVQTLLPPINSTITYQLKGDEDRKVGKITSRAGKATGGNRFCLNILDIESNRESCIDFEKQIENWEKYEVQKENDFEEILFGTILKTKEVEEAKQQEIQKWKMYDVFEEVKDEGQPTTSVRWVITKNKENYKARLVARGYEEECFKDLRKDSPTIGKPTFRMTLAVISSNKWEVNSLDIQSAYLQGEPVDREVFLRPPPEVQEPNTLWRLKKAVYGLGDGGRKWYLKVENEIQRLNAKKSKFDPAVFIWHDDEGNLEGIVASHVDDFLWGGNKLFETNIIAKLKETFKISKEQRENFKHLGLEIQQRNIITVTQTAYVNEMKFLEYDKTKNKDEELNEIEKKTLRTFVGQIQWIASQTRPDLCFNACEASVEFSRATINTLHKANKTIRKMKNYDVKLKYPNIGNLRKCKIYCFTDASLHNLSGNNSQYGYLIFLTNENNQIVPIAWKSAKCKRVVNSTLGAECLALIEGAGASYYIRKILTEILQIEDFDIPIECFIDSKNLHDAVKSTHSVTDPRVLVDICEIRDKIEKKEINKVHWIRSQYQLANVLTKNNASAEPLLCAFDKSEI